MCYIGFCSLDVANKSVVNPFSRRYDGFIVFPHKTTRFISGKKMLKHNLKFI